jgi:hypothetical protein
LGLFGPRKKEKGTEKELRKNNTKQSEAIRLITVTLTKRLHDLVENSFLATVNTVIPTYFIVMFMYSYGYVCSVP